MVRHDRAKADHGVTWVRERAERTDGLDVTARANLLGELTDRASQRGRCLAWEHVAPTMVGAPCRIDAILVDPPGVSLRPRRNDLLRFPQA
jgi:hypothetical protein